MNPTDIPTSELSSFLSEPNPKKALLVRISLSVSGIEQKHYVKAVFHRPKAKAAGAMSDSAADQLFAQIEGWRAVSARRFAAKASEVAERYADRVGALVEEVDCSVEIREISAESLGKNRPLRSVLR